MQLFSEYRGLRKEMYVLFFGRVVTVMGSLIWPMLTLILSHKLHMSASEIATLMLLMTIIQLPTTMIGGKLADHFNKRNIIIVCDLITVGCYLICGFVEINIWLIVLFFIGGMFARFEEPSYDALVADLSSSQDRERAYSLNYLGSNIGVVVAPTLGGFLFNNHLNLSFIISGLATLSSTILIYLFIKDVSCIKEMNSEYETNECEQSSWQVLKQRKIIFLYFFVIGIMMFVYSQFNYLMPLNLEALYQNNGALYFGTLTSLNGLTVILFTPLLTQFLRKITDVDKIMLGECLIILSFCIFIFVQGNMMIYYFMMIIFTWGEIISTLGQMPYLTRRIPSSHRGRIAGMMMVFKTLFQGVSQKGMGVIIDHYSYPIAWLFIVFVGVVSLIMILILQKWDRKNYPIFYK